MIYSKTSGYAIRALSYMASFPLGHSVGIGSIAKGCRVSPTYMAKVLQVLTHAGFISSIRGAKGGYVFRKDPSKISLLDVIQTTDNSKKSPLNNCVMGLAECSNVHPCLVHYEWKKMNVVMKKKLKKSTVLQLSSLLGAWNKNKKSGPLLSKKVRAVFSK
ncbi:MAG: RrF2 family transcriptional regulator [Elusimicrobiota bacterium]